MGTKSQVYQTPFKNYLSPPPQPERIEEMEATEIVGILFIVLFVLIIVFISVFLKGEKNMSDNRRIGIGIFLFFLSFVLFLVILFDS